MKKQEQYTVHKWTNPHLRHLVEMEENDVDEAVADALKLAGQALKRERTRQKLTQKQLSSRSNIPQGQISRIENGREQASVEMLVRLANGMGKKLRIELEDRDAAH